MMDEMVTTGAGGWRWGREGVLAAVRGGALFLGGFSLLNVAGEWWRVGFDANEWWIDLRDIPAWAGTGLMLVSGVMMMAWAIWPRMRRGRFYLTVLLLTYLMLQVAANVGQFYRLAGGGIGAGAGAGVRAGMMVPFSAVVLVGLAGVMAGLMWVNVRWPRGAGKAARAWQPGWKRSAMVMGGMVGVCGVAFPLGQMACFGKTDYRRPADGIVVFGAKVFADGKLSDAAQERVLEAVKLYRAGLAGRMMMSGGPGDGAIYEADAMRAYAMEMGVPGEAIAVDRGGVNTEATVRNTTAWARAAGVRRLLAVSHFYHLPRVKMAYERAGWDEGAGGCGEVFTVPVHSPYVLRGLPRFVVREVAALWAYYARAACGGGMQESGSMTRERLLRDGTYEEQETRFPDEAGVYGETAGW